MQENSQKIKQENSQKIKQENSQKLSRKIKQENELICIIRPISTLIPA